MKNFSKLLCILLCLCIACPVVSVFAESTTASGVTLQMDKIRELPEGNNLISGKLPYQVDYIPPGKGHVETTYLPENEQITDGDVNTDWLDSKKVFADYNNGDPIIYTNGESRCDLVYHLDKVTDISKICMIHHSASALMTEKYEIYASGELRTLFWPKNKVAYVENPDSMDRQILECNIQDVAYFAVRILCPTQIGDTSNTLEVTATKNNHYPRINELAIYGTEGDYAPSPYAENSCSKTELMEVAPNGEALDMTKSLFYGLEPKAYKYKEKLFGFLGTGEESVAANSKTALTDGDLTINGADWHVSSYKFAKRDSAGNVTVNGSDTHYIDIKLDLDSSQPLGVFYIRQHGTNGLRTMHYKVFASTTTNKRTAAESLIAEVRNNNGSLDHYFLVPEGQKINARYYTIRVYDPCYDYSAPALQALTDDGTTINNSYVRLLEVAAFTPEFVNAKLELDNFQKVDGTNYGYVKPGTEVKSIMNSFKGRGELRVENANGRIKAPDEALQCGDKVIVDTNYGAAEQAGFKFRGDLNNDDSFNITDVQLLCDSIINNTTNSTLGDVNDDSYVTVTDMICLSSIIVGKNKGVEDTTPEPIRGIKEGISTNGRNEIIVDTNTVINDDFRGFGTNSFTSILTPEGMSAYKYNKVYHELTAKRLASMKHPVSRIWFQVDWIVTDTLGDGYKNYETNWQNNPDYKNYINGIYDFENETMQAFYEYVEMLNDTGCNIEINFGWKTATRIKDWFNAPCENYMVGAPQDLTAFGKAAAALIKHLNEVKKYDFVEAITFYNEPNLEGDFEIDTVDDRIYWSQLIYEVDAALKANGMRDKVEIWGPEVSGMSGDATKSWFQYQLDNTAAYIDKWTGHNYFRYTENKNNYSDTFDLCLEYASKTNGNMLITEMYAGIGSNSGFRDWRNWNDSFTGYYIAVSNAGLDGMFTWGSVGGYLPNPLYMKLDGGSKAVWEIPNSEKAAANVKSSFYEQTIFTNYIPDGSKVLYTGWVGKDIRAASYLLPDGNVTVVVENNGRNGGAVLFKGVGEAKTVTVNFSDGEDRTFNRISYIPDEQVINANATVNRPDKQIEAENGTFTDNYGEQYSVHLYTTAPIVKQIEMDNVIVHTTPTQPVSVKGKMIDCAANDEIVYTISEFTGAEAGFVSGNGNYTPATSAKKGDMIAVRASLKSDPNVFGVSIIYID